MELADLVSAMVAFGVGKDGGTGVRLTAGRRRASCSSLTSTAVSPLPVVSGDGEFSGGIVFLQIEAVSGTKLHGSKLKRKLWRIE
ncbi:hypothetical protein V2J09_007712 [Rumex salicifolius]